MNAHMPPPAVAAALDLAARGWHVFPCHPGSKRPLTSHGLHDATTDTAQIKTWWQASPDAMIGVRTGPESGVWVLDGDVDPAKGIDGLKALDEREAYNGRLPDTILSRTPRGGRHWFFRWTDGIRNSAGKAAAGVDVRGAGGYVIVPPSRRGDGVGYAWENPPGLFEPAEAPDWLVSWVKGEPIPDPFPEPGRANPASGFGDRYAETAMDDECHGVAMAAPGMRNDALNCAAFNLGQLVTSGALDEGRVRARLLDAATACGLVASDGRGTVDRTIDSGLRAGMENPRDPCRRARQGGPGRQESSGGREEPASGPKPALEAAAFGWCDPRTIEMRQWVYGRHYIRKFVSVTVAPGGVGKSSLAIAEALAMVSGRNILGEPSGLVSKVWYWNGEDPYEELQRRVMATALHHGLTADDVVGRLFVNSGRQTEIVVAEQTKSGITLAVPVVEAVKATILANGIDVVILDPFVSTHRVSENDNMAVDRVAKAWARIADETGCAVELVHHARKTNGNEVTMEDGRGAVALLAAARSGRILNVMSQDEAERAGVERRRLHFRVDNGKANLAPPPEGTTWFKLASVPLGNGPLGTEGDSVGVVESWKWPDPLDDVSVADLRAAQKAVGNGRWRENVQAGDWVGKPIATALGLDLNNPVQKEKVKRLLKVWIATGMFVVVTGKDEKRMDRSFVEVGECASD